MEVQGWGGGEGGEGGEGGGGVISRVISFQGFRALGFMVEDFGLKVWDLGLQGLGFKVFLLCPSRYASQEAGFGG